MILASDNPVAALCAHGMELTGDEAAAAFLQAWEIASTDTDKTIAAHYVARIQDTVREKLVWDELALQHALASGDPETIGFLPSLYLNSARCHEELGDTAQALAHYELAEKAATALPEDGYSSFVRTGIANGITRVRQNG